MLAIKSVIMDSDRDAETLIFDEIDAGVGGKVAEYIGRKLERLAQGRQILCITHLAQVAAYAKSHYVIDKKEDSGSTTVSLRPVTSKNQVEELARMVGGEEISETSRRLARELLSRASDQTV
jgi:DNA repair protein RecN (Recombination protein N)